MIFLHPYQLKLEPRRAIERFEILIYSGLYGTKQSSHSSFACRRPRNRRLRRRNRLMSLSLRHASRRRRLPRPPLRQ